MSDETPQALRGAGFLAACIEYLKTQELRIKTGVSSLEALMPAADRIDGGDLEAMARTIMDRTMNPHLVRHVGSSPAPRAAEEPDIDQQPVPEPREPTIQEKAGYLEIVSYLLKGKNCWSSGASLSVYCHLSMKDLATILRATHADNFERGTFKSGKSKWRLKPDVFESLIGSQPSRPDSPHTAGTLADATISMSLFPPRSPAMTQIEAAAHVLKQTGAPLSTNEIVDRIVRLNLYPVEGDLKQFVNSIFSAMRRKPDIFAKLGRGMWGLTEWAPSGGNAQ